MDSTDLLDGEELALSRARADPRDVSQSSGVSMFSGQNGQVWHWTGRAG